MMVITATEMQNNFGHYLQAVQSGDEIIILKNGNKVARLIAYDASLSYLTDSLTGVLKNNYDEKKMNAERIEMHESIS